MTGADVANIAVVIGLLALAAVIYRTVLRAPTSTRITVVPAELAPDDERQFTSEDQAFIADLTARMKTYGAQVADYYDTDQGDQ
jgi:hypothetical protein